MRTFRDGELRFLLPDANWLVQVDDLTSGVPGHLPRVDWAWREPRKYFLCELKDPESERARVHDPRASARMLAELAGPEFPGRLAEKAYYTITHHVPTQSRKRRVYIVLAAISRLNAADMGIAQLLIQNHLKSMGVKLQAIVVNLDAWNLQLAPRRVTREP